MWSHFYPRHKETFVKIFVACQNSEEILYKSRTDYLLTDLTHDQGSLPYLLTTNVQPQWVVTHG